MGIPKYTQRPDISFFWGYYILSISRPPKKILYPITITAKDMDIYPISFVKNFVPKVIKYICKTPALSQFLNNEKPGSTAAQESLNFYRIKLIPRSISGIARKWQITAEMAEMAVLKEKSSLKPKISGTERGKKDIG
jgi:hypothetical protein